MMIESRLMLIAIACVLVTVVTFILFKYKKLHGRKEAEMDKEDVIGKLFLRKLSKIDATVGKDDPEQIFKKLSKTMRSFFSELYDIRYQFDYFELNEELGEKGVKEDIRKDIIELTMQMSKTEYGGQTVNNIVIYPLLEKSLNVVNRITGQAPEPAYTKPAAGEPPVVKEEPPKAVKGEIPSAEVPQKEEMPAAEKPLTEPPTKEPVQPAEEKPPAEEMKPPAEPQPTEKPPAEGMKPPEEQQPPAESKEPVSEKPPEKEAPPAEQPPPEKEKPPEEKPPEKVEEAPPEKKEEPVPAEKKDEETVVEHEVIIPPDDKGKIDTIKRKLLVAEQELRSKDYENAMDSYTELKSIYDSISPGVKEGLYDDIKRIIDIYNTLLKEYKDTLTAKK
jgi:hypothetical protein